MTAPDAADTLRRAAMVLREHAEVATGGRWCYYLEDLWLGDSEALAAFDADPENVLWPHGEDESGHVFAGDPHRPEDARYIALMDPRVGLVLADWLDAAAAEVEMIERINAGQCRCTNECHGGHTYSMPHSLVSVATQVARCVLREQS